MTNSAKPFAYMPPPLIDDPGADEWTRPFWEAAANEQLVAPRCTECGTFRMPPGRFCIACLSQQVEWVLLPGTGSVHTFTVVRTSPVPEALEYLPYLPAAVEADGAPGIRFVSNIVDCPPDDVTMGMRVRVVWHRANDVMSIPFWRSEIVLHAPELDHRAAVPVVAPRTAEAHANRDFSVRPDGSMTPLNLELRLATREAQAAVDGGANVVVGAELIGEGVS